MTVTSTNLAHTGSERVSGIDIEIFWVVLVDAVEKTTKFALPRCQAHIDNTIQIPSVADSTNHEVALTHERRAQMMKD